MVIEAKCSPLSGHFVAILWKPDTLLTLIEAPSGQEKKMAISKLLFKILSTSSIHEVNNFV